MECKDIGGIIDVLSGINWNISRMECKVTITSQFTDRIGIGIYQEWNVKIIFRISCSTFTDIGIYPEWNVKIYSIWVKKEDK